MIVEYLPTDEAERQADELDREAHEFTIAACDRRLSIPARKLARRRAQLLTYAAGALLRYAWTYDTAP